MSLAEYAKIHGKSGDTLHRMAERGGAFNIAQKIGRNWKINSDEEYPVRKRAPKNCSKASPIITPADNYENLFILLFHLNLRVYDFIMVKNFSNF
jgi:hypothetical protein